MADKFIDKDEVSIYGAHASKRIRGKVIGLIAAYDAALTYVADHLDASTQVVEAAVASARKKDAESRKGSMDKAPVLAQAVELLVRFSNHLDSHKSGAVDRKSFFMMDGTVRGIGKSAHNILLAVNRIAGELNDASCSVQDRVDWHKEFSDMALSLGSVVAFSNDIRTDRRELTPEVRAARDAWLNMYQAAKALVESVLRLTGRMNMMATIFHDLAVPSHTQLTVAPKEDEGTPPSESAQGG